MKQSEILPLAMAAKPVVVVEFRDWEVNDRKGNVIESTFVFMGRTAVTVKRFAPRGTPITAVQRPAYKQGDKLVLVGTVNQTEKYGVESRGELHKLEA
jgi:hypothetical protein